MKILRMVFSLSKHALNNFSVFGTGTVTKIMDMVAASLD